MKPINWKAIAVSALLSIILYTIMPVQARAAQPGPPKEDPIPNGLVLQGEHYVLYVEGIQITETGWQELSNKKFQVSREGYVTAKMETVNGNWRFYRYDADSTGWKQQKNVWESVNGKHAAQKDYYFDTKGYCTKIYDPNTKKCTQYSKGKMVSVKKEICTLRDGKTYLFNAKGIRVSQAGWQTLSSGKLIQTTKSGLVLSKMEKLNGTWRFYKYDQTLKKWDKQKSAWKTVNKKKYYFNASGKCIHMYDTASKKYYDIKKGKRTAVKNATRDISGKRYYFGPNGVKASSAGLYLTSAKRLIYATSNGRVTKQISGKVLDCTVSKGRVKSSRVKDSHYMCYYDSKGTLKRRINLNKKMVALTYDDGPSQYTPVILDVLKKYNSVATFFVVGQRVSSYASTLKRTYEMGCEIGNHTYDHTILTSVGIPSIQSQIAGTNTAVKNITGASPVVMRPPGGGYNGTVKSAVKMPLILWSIDTLDWKTRSAPATQAAVLNYVKDGDVVLMHDLHGPTAEASKTIIPGLVDRGYQLVTVSELADCRGAMSKGVVYSSWRR